MSSLDQRILDLLTELDRGYGGAGATARGALRAVLALHPRVPSYDGADWFMCASCRLVDDDSCPTVRAIARELGVLS